MCYISNAWSNLRLTLLVMLFIQSCAPLAKETQASSIASSIPSTQETFQITLSTPEPTLAAATLIKNATLTACMATNGHVEINDIATDLLPQPLLYRIYLPPCYDEQTDRYYPVLYLIHGKDASDSQWVYMGATGTVDRLVPKGELPPFIIVMPRDRVWYEPAADNFGLAVVQLLVPWVDEHYRTLPDRKYRAIGGLSRGGAWAVHIGFAHPELFGAVGLHSSVVFNTDVTAIGDWVNNFQEGTTPRIYIDIGDKDRNDIIQETTWVEKLLTKHGIPHEWHMGEGGHNDIYWRAHVEEYLRWYSRDWASEPALP